MYEYYLLDITGCPDPDEDNMLHSIKDVIIDGTDDKNYVQKTYETLKKKHPKRKYFIGVQRVYSCWQSDL